MRNPKTVESMISYQKVRSAKNVEKAITEMRKLAAAGKELNISEISKTTDLSRQFFYKNKQVREEYLRLIKKKEKEEVHKEDPLVEASRKRTIDKLRAEIEQLKKEPQEAQFEISKLKQDLEDLKEAYEDLEKSCTEENERLFQQMCLYRDTVEEYENRGYIIDR